jgi:hypothetical protein
VSAACCCRGRVRRAACGGFDRTAVLAGDRTAVLAGDRTAVLAGDVAATAEDRGGGDDRGQRQHLTGQVGGPGPDVLGEQERPEQAGRQRVQDGEPGLGGGQRPGGQGVRGQ